MKREKTINNELYDLIIIGAGAAGLFAGASLSNIGGKEALRILMLERKSRPGRKLLITGGGQCNLTNQTNIKDFIPHYGANGPKIRPILYQFNNLALMKFFQNKGLPLVSQEDGKVYPKSLKSQDVLNILMAACNKNAVKIRYSSPVTNICKIGELFAVTVSPGSFSQQFLAKTILITAGGSSFPTTGSDGSLLPVLEELGLKIVNPKPALTPIYVENYPYGSLSGLSIENISVTISDFKNKKSYEFKEDLLFTHDCFSGPAILNASRLASPGVRFSINYVPHVSKEKLLEVFSEISKASKLQVDTALYNSLNTFKPFPRSFCQTILNRANLDPKKRASQTSKADLNKLFDYITRDEFTISGTKGFQTTMATAGGVSLDEINLKTMESTRYPGLYLAGEILDVDGDTGGYNLQFAFSSAYLAMKAIKTKNNKK